MKASDYPVNDIEYKYFMWLCERSNMASPFLFLARALHQREFSVIVPKDISRIADGRALREKFLDTCSFSKESERNKAQHTLDKPECSVLEMLVALADRLNYMYQDSPYEKSTGGWMDELLRNLSIGYMTDQVLVDYPEYLDRLSKILHDLIERRYGTDGRGGLFPLNQAKRDQRNLEIWEQMMDYCAEKYDLGT